MSELDLDAVLAALKPFQRAAVDHVTEQFFGPGAEFVHHAGRSGIDAVELSPGGALVTPHE